MTGSAARAERIPPDHMVSLATAAPNAIVPFSRSRRETELGDWEREPLADRCVFFAVMSLTSL